MNLIKATIATAAVIACCLGNEMPAQALTDEQREILRRGIEDITNDWNEYRRDQNNRYRTCHHNFYGGMGTTTCY